jgi:hypothetical protein
MLKTDHQTNIPALAMRQQGPYDLAPGLVTKINRKIDTLNRPDSESYLQSTLGSLHLILIWAPIIWFILQVPMKKCVYIEVLLLK